ncbi:hypothetical protein [Enterovibrio norvegicus]|uniref:Uncharacterized protein n=1 Tax=Enterovibrio norvegicus DSM 15893 TaxID=1121869 RepID=A0A1I5JDF2_9GAMM|nr:hypothetical protein [Enterovibrio norvegicus]SFO70613.1 hypothetical protein SAMN03084138_00116 [Enterovibrio norvegicus DSM 15893]
MRVGIASLDDNQRVALWESAMELSPAQRAITILAAHLPTVPFDALQRWTLVGRDHALLLAYRSQFGEGIQVEGRCQACDTKTQLAFTVSDLLESSSDTLKAAVYCIGSRDESGNQYKHQHTQASLVDTDVYVPSYYLIAFSGNEYRFRLPTTQDLVLIQASSSSSNNSGGITTKHVCERLLDQASFNDLCAVFADKHSQGSATERTKNEREQQDKGLESEEQKAWTSTLDALEQEMLRIEPLTIVSLNASCPECGAQTQHQFDIGHQYWALLAADVEKQLWDVHILATAYGWSSDAILSMSPARRRQHIAMVIS